MDAYYSLNFNHLASRTNQLRNFDNGANQFSLNMAKLVMAHDADPVGFRVDLGFGGAMDILHGADPGGLNTFRHIQQAYVSVKAGKGTFDFGSTTPPMAPSSSNPTATGTICARCYSPGPLPTTTSERATPTRLARPSPARSTW